MVTRARKSNPQPGALCGQICRKTGLSDGVGNWKELRGTEMGDQEGLGERTETLEKREKLRGEEWEIREAKRVAKEEAQLSTEHHPGTIYPEGYIASFL